MVRDYEADLMKGSGRRWGWFKGNIEGKVIIFIKLGEGGYRKVPRYSARVDPLWDSLPYAILFGSALLHHLTTTLAIESRGWMCSCPLHTYAQHSSTISHPQRAISVSVLLCPRQRSAPLRSTLYTTRVFISFQPFLQKIFSTQSFTTKIYLGGLNESQWAP